MTGFATQYYDEDGSLTEISTIVPLSPTITIGKKTVQMEVTHLSQIFSTYVEKTAPRTGSAFMTTMAPIIGSFQITKWVQGC